MRVTTRLISDNLRVDSGAGAHDEGLHARAMVQWLKMCRQCMPPSRYGGTTARHHVQRGMPEAYPFRQDWALQDRRRAPPAAAPRHASKRVRGIYRPEVNGRRQWVKLRARFQPLGPERVAAKTLLDIWPPPRPRMRCSGDPGRGPNGLESARTALRTAGDCAPTSLGHSHHHTEGRTALRTAGDCAPPLYVAPYRMSLGGPSG